MEHGPATQWRNEKSQGYKSRAGVIMFAIFAPIYLAFILISVVSPAAMATDIGNLNLAIVYGFGIIILAIIQAVIYNIICSNKEKYDHVDDDVKGAAR